MPKLSQTHSLIRHDILWLQAWGRPGFGKWLTVYAKRGHVFMMIAGLRFDTSGSGRGVGPRWYTTARKCGGFKVRHVPGY